MAGETIVPLIRRLTIERFRGIEKLVWYPEAGLNVILGGGDVGKTTILDAIGLVLSPTNTTLLSDADYWQRQVETGFCIEAVMSLPETVGINQQTKNAWPWEWDGKHPRLPKVDGDAAAATVEDPVYCLRARGTPDFDLAFEIMQPDGSVDHLPVGLRRKIGLVRLGGDDRNDRDLRLVQGSALDRLLADKTLRARLGQTLAQGDIEDQLKDEAKKNLHALDAEFERQALPCGLGLGLTGGQGLSVNALIGLTATRASTKLPLASWGAGTRRLAALEIAAANQGENAVTLVDELERGLEPYRQRVLVSALHKRESQTFLTTHSAAALKSAARSSIWYVDSDGQIGRLPHSVSRHLQRDPEAFLARITIVAEGVTEVGFVTSLLKRTIEGDLLRRGIWITDAGGNVAALELLEGLAGSGLKFGGFADDEGVNTGKWVALKQTLGPLLFRWQSGCLEENILNLVPEERLEDIITDPLDELTGERLRTLATRLDIEDKRFASIRGKAVNLRALIIEASTGRIPDNKKNAEKDEKKALKRHADRWFKSVEGGAELADKVYTFGLWPLLEAQLLTFLNAVRAEIGLPELSPEASTLGT